LLLLSSIISPEQSFYFYVLFHHSCSCFVIAIKLIGAQCQFALLEDLSLTWDIIRKQAASIPQTVREKLAQLFLS
jgi:hypothetical protein